MCGIAGVWQSARSSDELRQLVERMTERLRHRGPDDGGAAVFADDGVALGHRRLSILDLSPLGRQPMASACGRFHLTYNGEIYNFAALRDELRSGGVVFRGGSDTEVLLAAIAQWGVLEAARRSIGMFAFAVWDQERRRLTLVRDRLGIKPLYYARCQGALLFGSELKALREAPGFSREIDRDALRQFLRYGYVPAPATIYRAARKLTPGCLVAFERESAEWPPPTAYWSLPLAVAAGRERPAADLAEARRQLGSLIDQAVLQRMVADVPLGAFLSGGIDSTLVASAMQRQSTARIKTFCIGFDDPRYDESPHARAVAERLGTDHTTWMLTAEGARSIIPQLPEVYDEPFADSSQIPTLLLSKLTRNEVTVALSGDGGDELFGGYRRYFDFRHRWGRMRRWPAAARRITGWSLRQAARRAPDRWRDKLSRRARLLGVRDALEMYAVHNSQWRNSQELVLDEGERGAAAPWLDAGLRAAGLAGLAPEEQWMLHDTLVYLPDDILVKVDRASMAFGLEARVPLLDHRIAEFAWTLPLEWKMRGDVGKWLLQELLAEQIPSALFQRPKMGFGIPLGDWLRGPLVDWAESLLDAARLRREGLLDFAEVRRVWEIHRSGRQNWEYLLWDVLMFQSWLERER